MDGIENNNCISRLWEDRAVAYYHDISQIYLVTMSPMQAFKEGFLQSIGPSAKDDREIFYFDSSRLKETVIFAKALKDGVYSSRAEVCESWLCLPACCVIDQSKNSVAVLVDICVAPYFCRRGTNDGLFFCGAAFGDCFNIPKDCVFYAISGVYLPLRCCFFNTIGPGKQTCIPFPMVDAVLYSSDCKRCCREGKTWSEEARQQNEPVIDRQPQLEPIDDHSPAIETTLESVQASS